MERRPGSDLGRLRRSLEPLAAAALGIALAGCGGAEDAAPPYDWDLPPGLPEPWVSPDNPMTREKVELGRHLFYDKKLSGNETYSCASCHEQARAFSDGLSTPLGSTGQPVARNAPALVNLGYLGTYTWMNPTKDTLESQALTPLFGTLPVEMGIGDKVDEALGRLRGDAAYPRMFARAFPGDAEPISVGNLIKAIASFERSMISGSSPYDKAVYQGDTSAMSEAAQRGFALFNSEKVECYHCHNATNFTDSFRTATTKFTSLDFRNTGLYNIGGTGAYPVDNTGLFEFTKLDEDMGKFRVAPLRNIELTAPYMHDGSIATLEEVIDFYAAGGRNIAEGPNAGDGRKSPYKSQEIRGFTLTAEEKEDLLAFLRSLTDTAFVEDPRFRDPFASP